jgi:hypothetical protein
MEIEGKLIEILPVQSGVSQNGDWSKQDFVIETLSDYPKKVCITDFGCKLDIESYMMQENIKVSVNIESREFNGKWYTNVTAWKIEGQKVEDTKPEAEPNFDKPQPDDDLPFN